MSKKIAWLLLLGFLPFAGLFAQQQDEGGSLVKWMTLDTAMEKIKTQPRPLLIDFYTDWCGWCKYMMHTTYADADLANYINSSFYPVKFNAENPDTIEYLGEKYPPLANKAGKGFTSTLAIKLLNGKMVYPTSLFLNSFDKNKNEFSFNMTAQGYLAKEKLQPILIFSLENAFHNSGYDEFKIEYDSAFSGVTTEAKLKNIKWLTPAEVFNKNPPSKKKTIVFIHTDWCNACKVMYRASFLDTLLYDSVKQKFNIVDFNPEITDTLIYQQQAYVNPRTRQMPFHQLAMKLCRNAFTLPTLVVLDEQMNIIDAVPYYLTPQEIKNITTYYGDDIYKKKSWNDYMAEVKKK